MMDYESLKELAKQLKRPVKSLLALSPGNDPFYCGMDAQVEKAKWFTELWERFGYTSGVHLRRMHYQIISQEPPERMVNGKPYENTDLCWNYLGLASQAARYLEMVDPENFVDRRNGAPVDSIDYDTTHHAWAEVNTMQPGFWAMQLPRFPALPRYDFSVDSPQRYHLELWCEKSTQDDTLRPLAESYSAVLQYGLGELSITLAVEAVRRFEKSGKPVRIFYISDFDHAGWNMPQSMSAKLQYYNQKLDLNLDIKLFPVVLTPEQVRYYNLPATPAKESLGAIEKRFKERHHVAGFTELDALEALHPGALRTILEEELDRYYDFVLSAKVRRHWNQIERFLDGTSERVHAQHQEEITVLENEWQAIRDEFDKRIVSHSQKRDIVWQAIRDELEQEKPYIAEDEVPEADYADERDGALFDSSRDYLTQNDMYQAHKGKDEEIA